MKWKHFSEPGAIACVMLLAGCNREAAPGNSYAAPGPASATAPSQPATVTATPAPAPAPVVVPAGAQVRVRTSGVISTSTATTGDRIAASLEAPLRADSTVIAPRGSEVTLRVVNADPGGRVKGVAGIAVTIESVRLSSGKVLRLVAGTYGVEAPATRKKDALKVGIGSGIGAAIGAIAGGGKGAAIGAASGGGAGTGAVLLTRGDPAVIPAEAVIGFQLKAAARAE